MQPSVRTMSASELLSGPIAQMQRQLTGSSSSIWLSIHEHMRYMQPEELLKIIRDSLGIRFWEVLTGTHTKDNIHHMLDNAGYAHAGGRMLGIAVLASANYIISTFDWARSKEKVPVEYVSGSLKSLFGFELGKGTEASVFLKEEFLAQHGYALCEKEDGPYLRLQDLDQPIDGKRSYVGMRPVKVPDARHLCVFAFEHDQTNLVLDVADAFPEGGHLASSVWFFRKLNVKVG